MNQNPPKKITPDDAVWETLPEIQSPVYGIDQKPEQWWASLLYGWQHTLVDISPFVLPLAVGGALGMSASANATFINACLFAMGIATLIQTTIGNRLPIIQGPSATLTGTLAPLATQVGGPAMWGGVFVGGLIEMLIGASRILKFMRRLFPPAVSGVIIIAIGLSLGQLAIRLAVGDGRPLNFFFALAVMALIFFLQLRAKKILNGVLSRGAIFIAIWVVGIGLGSALGEVNWAIIATKPWLQLPQFFPYGGPGFGWEFTIPAVLVVLSGYLGSMVESLGDYAATCAVAGERYQVKHMNRGIFAEGLGSVLAALIGALPVTSYTQNIGIIATTGVASRYVVRIAAVILLLYGLCPKFGALLVAMPRPVLGGVFVVVCGMIIVSGIRLLHVTRSTDANAFLIGVTLVVAVGIPGYTQFILGEVWLAGLPIALRLLATNGVVLAVLVSVGLNLVLNILLARDTDE